MQWSLNRGMHWLFSIESALRCRIDTQFESGQGNRKDRNGTVSMKSSSSGVETGEEGIEVRFEVWCGPQEWVWCSGRLGLEPNSEQLPTVVCRQRYDPRKPALSLQLDLSLAVTQVVLLGPLVDLDQQLN